MIRKNLIQWQWSDYSDKHQSRKNLWIHIFAVPMFWVGIFGLLQSFFTESTYWFWLGPVLLFSSFALQGAGHRSEKEAPNPFLGYVDFVSRFLTEQFVNFPRFLLTGKWLKSLRK